MKKGFEIALIVFMAVVIIFCLIIMGINFRKTEVNDPIHSPGVFYHDLTTPSPSPLVTEKETESPSNEDSLKQETEITTENEKENNSFFDKENEKEKDDELNSSLGSEENSFNENDSEGEEIESEKEKDVPHTHEYTKTVISPSCVDGGYTVFSCSCGEVYKDEFTNAISHTWGKWKEIKKATTVNEGKKERACLLCEKVEAEKIEKVKAVNLNSVISIDVLDGAPDDVVLIIDSIYQAVNDYRTGTLDIDEYRKHFAPGSKSLETTAVFETDTCLSNEDICFFESYFGICFGSTSRIREVYEDGYKKYFINYKIADELIRKQEEALKQIDAILSNFEDGNEKQLVDQIVSYIASNFDYQSGQADLVQGFESRMLNCEGTAMLFKLMALRLGIQCDICYGFTVDGEYHAWNKITYSDGSVRYSDVTYCTYYKKALPQYTDSDKPLHFCQSTTINRRCTSDELEYYTEQLVKEL